MSIFIKAGLWTSKKTGYKGELNLTQLFSGGGNNSYSETESLTGGTWIDGKPIYRKVIPFTVPGVLDAPAAVGIVHNLNIDKYLRADVTVDAPVGVTTEDAAWFFPITMAKATSNVAISATGVIMLNRNNVTFEEVQGAILSTNDFLLILEYTKI